MSDNLSERAMSDRRGPSPKHDSAALIVKEAAIAREAANELVELCGSVPYTLEREGLVGRGGRRD